MGYRLASELRRADPATRLAVDGIIGEALSVTARCANDPIRSGIPEWLDRARLAGVDPGPMRPEDITARADQGDMRCMRAVDVFCARTAPRSYRDQVSPGRALYHLASNPARYDVSVVAALAAAVRIVGSDIDDRLRPR